MSGADDCIAEAMSKAMAEADGDDADADAEAKAKAKAEAECNRRKLMASGKSNLSVWPTRRCCYR